jgi:Reverse transcriptase (RNA-dependent DNA polymerase)
MTFDETEMLKVMKSQPAKKSIKEAETIKEKVNFEISDTSFSLHKYNLIFLKSLAIMMCQMMRMLRNNHILLQEINQGGKSSRSRRGGFGEPSNYKEAVASSDVTKWRAATKEKIHYLQKNKTWTLVEQSKNKKVVGCKWVFKKKDDAEGVRYKVRLAAKGYSQVEGVDFNEVFSPVVKHTSIRVLLSLMAMKNYELKQLDVKTAFLHCDLEE